MVTNWQNAISPSLSLSQYAGTIVAHHPLLESLAQDTLAPALQSITGNTFSVIQENVPILAIPNAENPAKIVGIHLLLSNVAGHPDLLPRSVNDALPTLERAVPLPFINEAYLLDTSVKHHLWIAGATIEGVTHGVHDYLHRLGMRWYLPGDAWTITPRLSDIRIRYSGVISPQIRTVAFAGTGGWGAALPIDDSSGPQQRWQRWMSRLRIPGAFKLGGHTGEAFLRERLDELRADPRHLAEVDGERQQLPAVLPKKGMTTKLHYTYHGGLCGSPDNPEPCNGQVPTWEDPDDYSSDGGVVKLYADWRLQVLDQAVEQNRLRAAAFISAEPADGLQHCNCSKCLNLLRRGPYHPRLPEDSSVSDRVFHLVNETANRVRAAYPEERRGVSILAYNAHADTPSIPLVENLYVAVIPYAFHSPHTGLSPEQLIDKWVSKRDQNPSPFHLGIYDYWCVPDWTWDQPTTSPELALERLSSAIDKGCVGFSMETTYGALPMLLPTLVTAARSWSSTVSVDALLDEFCQKAFGAARIPIRRLLDRWRGDFRLTEDSLARSFSDLAEAKDILDPDPAMKTRWEHLVLYTHYLRLYLEFQYLKRPAENSSDADRQSFEKAMEALLVHVWRLRETGLVATNRLQQLLLSRYRSSLDSAFISRWSTDNDDTADAVWVARTRPYSSNEIEDIRNADLQRYQVLHYPPLTGQSTPLQPVHAQLVPGRTIASAGLVASHEFLIHCDGIHVLEFALELVKINRLDTVVQRYPTQVIIRDAADRVVFSEHYPVADSTPVSVPALSSIAAGVLSEGIYTVSVQRIDIHTRFRLLMPSQFPFVQVGAQLRTSFDNATKQFFYVPSDINRVVIYAPSTQPLRVFRPDQLEHTGLGGSLMQTHGPNVYYFDVPDQFRGSAWALSDVVSKEPLRWEFINLPHAVAFTREHVFHAP